MSISWIAALTVEEAIVYVHDSKKNLFEVVKEAIAECLNW